MNRGEAFEKEVYFAIRKALRRGDFGFRPEACHVYHHKAYYSKERERDIIVDVSMELYLPGAPKPSLIWIWECKDYTGRVPVNDVEEFHAKIQQIGEDNTKGTLITRGVLQESALKYAISKGIGVARLMPGNKVRISWGVYRKMSSMRLIPQKDENGNIILVAVEDEAEKKRKEDETRRALSEPEFIADERWFFAINSVGQIVRSDFETFLKRELKLSGMRELDLWCEEKPWGWSHIN